MPRARGCGAGRRLMNPHGFAEARSFSAGRELAIAAYDVRGVQGGSLVKSYNLGSLENIPVSPGPAGGAYGGRACRSRHAGAEGDNMS